MTAAPSTNPRPARQRSGQRQRATREAPSVRPARAIAPAEQPASTAPRACAVSDGARTPALPASDAQEVGGLATGQVDEVGLADRLRARGVVGAGPVADQDRLDLRAERPRNGRCPSSPSA